MKTCTTCKTTKSVSEFGIDRSTSDGMDYRCKPCQSRRSLAWNRANREKKNENNRRHAAKHREHYKEYARNWRIKNGSESDAKRYPLRKAQIIAKNKWRKAQLLRACPSWANSFFISEAYELAALRTKVFGYSWHVDHIIPLRSAKVCGLHVENNLQVIPGSLNMRKQNFYWPDMPEAI